MSMIELSRLLFMECPAGDDLTYTFYLSVIIEIYLWNTRLHTELKISPCDRYDNVLL